MADLGAVYLVGAGPGDPGLITVKGLELVRTADVIVYDRLVDPRIVAESTAYAERVYARDEPSGRPADQNDINEIMIAHARQGRRVVRLKGGDPFLFGRGGEEADALVAAGITFEVVPGVTSALAVPAYAGIPVTDRRFASSLRILAAPTLGNAEPDSRNAPSTSETVVALMAVRALPMVVADLLAEGWPADSPVALIERGTTARQRTVETTLGDAVDDAAQAGLRPPSIAVVGGVVNMRRRIAWSERRPLAGKRIIITRAQGQSMEIRRLLEAHGADALLMPALAFEAPQDWREVDAALARIQDFQWIAFTSAQGVAFFLRHMFDTGRDARHLGGVQIATVGSATTEALRTFGLTSDLSPERATSWDLGVALMARASANTRILLPRGGLADDALPTALEQSGLVAHRLLTYHTVAPPGLGRAFQDGLVDGVDAVIFASPSAVNNLAAALGENVDPLAASDIVSIGPTTTRAIQDAGWSVAIEADVPTDRGIADALVARARLGPTLAAS